MKILYKISPKPSHKKSPNFKTIAIWTQTKTQKNACAKKTRLTVNVLLQFAKTLKPMELLKHVKR